MNISKVIKYHGILIGLIILAAGLHFNYVMNHIYVVGSGVADVGWFIHLSTQALEFPLGNPEVAGLTPSYFSVHISPFFYVITFIYGLVSQWLSQPEYFSLFLSVGYSIVGISVYLMACDQFQEGTERMLVSCMAGVAVFNGVHLAGMGFPHFEFIIPALVLLVLTFHANKMMISSIVAFVFLLAVREDAGLHLALLFFSVALLHFLQTKRMMMSLVWYAVLASCYSFLAILVQKSWFPGDSAFQRIYSGEVFFGHLNANFLAERLRFFFEDRVYLWGPWLIALILAVLTRSWLYLAGFLAVIPWMFISIVAISPMAHALTNYYSFPLVMSTVWPLMAFYLIEKLGSSGRSQSRWALILAGLAPLLSVLTFSGTQHLDPKPWNSFHVDYMRMVKSTDRAITELCNLKSELGNVLIDEPVAALMPSCLDKNEWGFLNRFDRPSLENANTLFFYNSPRPINGVSAPAFSPIINNGEIYQAYTIKDTYIFVLTDRELKPIDGLIKLDHGEFKSRLPFNSAQMAWYSCELPSLVGTKKSGCAVVSEAGEVGFLTYGPYSKLPLGKYSFKYKYSATAPEDQVVGGWDIVSSSTTGDFVTLGASNVMGSDGKSVVIEGIFEVPSALAGETIEIRFQSNGVSQITAEELAIDSLNSVDLNLVKQ